MNDRDYEKHPYDAKVATMTFINSFEEECLGELYDSMSVAVDRACKKLGLDPEFWETWAIGFTHPDVPETMAYPMSVIHRKLDILTDGWDADTWSKFLSDRCNGCWNHLTDEVVECSGCGMFCTECYEKDSEGWYQAPYEESQNHCKDMCPTCVDEDEGVHFW